MPIKNLSNIRRLPRLGKIHLGIKVKNEKRVEYPKEVSYFVVPEKVQEVYGEKPTELKIMFPVENKDVFFQQWYKSYGFNLLKCKGDGEIALTWDEDKGGMKEIPCPCEKLESGTCRRIGILQFLLPDVKGAGVWQISTSSRNSIIDINSSVDYIRSICGRVRMIPLVLKRVETKIQRVENGKPKTGKHYTLQIDVDNVSLRQLQQSAQIEPEKVLLPMPDEDKDELFYPPKGFKPDEDKTEDKKEATVEGKIDEVMGQEESEKEAFVNAEIKALKNELSFVCAEYEGKIKKLSVNEQNRINEIYNSGMKGDYEKAIKHYKAELEKIDDHNIKEPEGLFEEKK